MTDEPFTRINPGQHGFISTNDLRPYYFKLYILHSYNNESSPHRLPDMQAYSIVDPDQVDLYSLDGVRSLYQYPVFHSIYWQEIPFLPFNHDSLRVFSGVAQTQKDRWVFHKADQITDLCITMSGLRDRYEELYRHLLPHQRANFIPIPAFPTDDERRELCHLLDTHDSFASKDEVCRAVARLLLYYIRSLGWVMAARLAVCQFLRPHEEEDWIVAAHDALANSSGAFHLTYQFTHTFSGVLASEKCRSVVYHSRTHIDTIRYLQRWYLRAWDLIHAYGEVASTAARSLLAQGGGREFCMRVTPPFNGHQIHNDQRSLAPMHPGYWGDWRLHLGARPEFLARAYREHEEERRRAHESDLKASGFYPRNDANSWDQVQPTWTSSSRVSAPSTSRTVGESRASRPSDNLPQPLYQNPETLRLDHQRVRGRGRGRGTRGGRELGRSLARESSSSNSNSPYSTRRPTNAHEDDRSRPHPHSYHPYHSPRSSNSDLPTRRSGSPSRSLPRREDSLVHRPVTPPRDERSPSPKLRRSPEPRHEGNQRSRTPQRSARSLSPPKRINSPRPRGRSLSPRNRGRLSSRSRSNSSKSTSRSRRSRTYESRSRSPPRRASYSPQPRSPPRPTSGRSEREEPSSSTRAPDPLWQSILEGEIRDMHFTTRAGVLVRVSAEGPSTSSPSSTEPPRPLHPLPPRPVPSGGSSETAPRSLASRIAQAPPVIGLRLGERRAFDTSSRFGYARALHDRITTRLPAPSNSPSTAVNSNPIRSNRPLASRMTNATAPPAPNPSPPLDSLYYRRWPSVPERYWREMFLLEDKDVNRMRWVKYLHEQRRRWDKKPFKKDLRLVDIHSSTVKVRKEFRILVLGPEKWLERLKKRDPKEYDVPLQVAWDEPLYSQDMDWESSSTPPVGQASTSVLVDADPSTSSANQDITMNEDNGDTENASAPANEEELRRMYGDDAESKED